MEQKKSCYELNPPAGLPTGTTGAIKELLVSADLLINKYHVFRSVSPTCPCDLIAMKGKRLFRIEVKTTYKNKNGVLCWPNKKDSHKRDIMALVTKEGQISYLPEMNKWEELI